VKTKIFFLASCWR